MKTETLGKIAGAGVALFVAGDALANGAVDVWNYSTSADEGQKVDVSELNPSSEYIRGSAMPLRMYGWGPTNGNPTDHAIGPTLGITSNFYSKTKIRLEVETLANGNNNIIWINPYGSMGQPGYSPLNMVNKNVVFNQDPNTPSPVKDTRTHDVNELTDGFTTNVQISLPNITASTPRSPEHYDEWNFIGTHKTDITYDGATNLKDFSKFAAYWMTTGHDATDNWGEHTDINKDGNTDVNDLKILNDNWLWDKTQPISLNYKINNEFLNEQRKKFFAKYGPKQLEAKLEDRNVA